MSHNLIVDNPNFSIIVPTGCNAKCSFCFWDRNVTRVKPEEYLEKLWSELQDLPDIFTQCSITGGEPTMLPWLKGILRLVRERFDKVVLSTNGYKLDKHLYMCDDGLIDHLNISRHDIGEKNNRQAFGTESIPSDKVIRALSRTFQNFGIDVTLNCVLSPEYDDLQFIHDYIDYAKGLNANSVSFRKDHSDLEFMGVEEALGKVIYSSSCPVCRSDVRLINGMTTTWKYSVKEPSNDLGGIYELIYHQDGRITSDWKGENIINTKDITLPVGGYNEETG